MSVSLGALLISLVLGAPPLHQGPSPVVRGATAPAGDSPQDRLWALLTAGVTPNAPRPTSPRYLALESRGFRGFELYVAWSLPGLAPSDAAALEAVASTLGGDDGWLVARLVRSGKADTVRVWFERRDANAWFGVAVSGSKRSATKDLELVVLETLAVFEAHAAPFAVVENAADQARAHEAQGQAPSDVSPALAGRVVRRLLTPSSRAVVEVQPPDAPQASRGVKIPVRHVVEKGDTLTHIARRNGLDLDALVKLNGLDPDAPIRPGDELRVSDKRARRPKLYVVKPGDTFAKVARRFGVSQDRLLEVNRMTARRVSVGQKLVLPP
ncbi:MAG TPA: LysM peptidoglycan-binding domain-containing protein [Polyangiaceae bacterium]